MMPKKTFMKEMRATYCVIPKLAASELAGHRRGVLLSAVDVLLLLLLAGLQRGSYAWRCDSSSFGCLAVLRKEGVDWLTVDIVATAALVTAAAAAVCEGATLHFGCAFFYLLYIYLAYCSLG